MDQVCAFWDDNGALGGGNFALLSLNPAGWDVPIADNCSGAQSGGTNKLTGWINGSIPVSVALNWTDPTYVCNDTGLRTGGSAQQAFDALRALQGEIRDFPINWEGCGTPIVPCPPVSGAPSQGTMYTQNGAVDKYDIIGFAAMEIVDVLSKHDVENGGTTTQQPFTDFTYNSTGITLATALAANASVTYTWTGHRTTGQQQPSGGTCMFTIATALAPGTYTWEAFGGNGINCPGNNNVLDPGQPNPAPTITVPVTTYGPCGDGVPHDSSAECVVLKWKGSTVTGDYPSDRQDDITVIRLCDLAYDTCLDRNHPNGT
jgi:hypothetical protein